MLWWRRLAVGLSSLKECLDAFLIAFNIAAESHLQEEHLQALCNNDGELQLDQFYRPLAEALRLVGAGARFYEPIFDKNFEVNIWKIPGKHAVKPLAPLDHQHYVDGQLALVAEKFPA